MITSVLPGLNQPNEVAADSAGCINTPRHWSRPFVAAGIARTW
jgi:hypothetical protein